MHIFCFDWMRTSCKFSNPEHAVIGDEEKRFVHDFKERLVAENSFKFKEKDLKESFADQQSCAIPVIYVSTCMDQGA